MTTTQEQKTTINTILLTLVTVLLVAIGGFVVSINSKLEFMREEQIKHNAEAEAWKRRIELNENSIQDLRTGLANIKASKSP